MKTTKGFSLLELTLVLGIGTLMAFLKFQDMIHEQESLKASAAGQQIRQLGEAVNGYINIRYDKLSVLSNAAGNGTDPGPRICSTATSLCTITYQTLINEGLLPSTYVAKNSFGSDYSIQLKRTGIAPNYVVDGIVITNSTWSEGAKTRYDLLGKAMQAAGIDSGMTKSNSQLDGYNGSWSYLSSSYSSISKAGLLGYRVGYNSAMYSIYLRRDGTLPMTGSLNMGANDVYNAKNITAAGNLAVAGKSVSDFPQDWSGIRTQDVLANGTIALVAPGAAGNTAFKAFINSSGDMYASHEITSGGQVIAHNGYGDRIALGGDNGGNDYEIGLSSAKPLTIYSPNAAGYTTVLQVDRNTVIQQRLATNGMNPNDLPSGWAGGIRTADIYAAGTVGAGNGGSVNAYMNSSGDMNASRNIYAGNDINVGHQVNSQYVWASGNLNSNYIHSNGNIDADKRVNAGEYVYINGQANIGWGCSPNGLIGRDGSGEILYCKDGLWKKSTGTGRQCNANGCYMTLFDGTVLQWGQTWNNQGGNSYITFPIAFPNACSNVSLTALNTSLSGNSKNVPYVNVSSLNNYSVWVSNGQSSAYGIMWYAIGY
ncbi:type II secretion system protein [Pluralibacter gergoviae]|uniref:type II secretion system protein n=1 Tax=Pluralibacter gergoviae TaxID=61647 RepID=UPI000ACC47DA|nr:type II secretion system protein [Pluralibacter gergoviae]